MYHKKENAKRVIIEELIKRGYGLEKKKKFWNISDSKLWYLTNEQAKEFIRLEKKDEKQKMFADEEKSLLKKHYKEISSLITDKNINILDLGCGNGKKAAVLINLIKNKFNIRYFPIDINEFMLKEAYKNVSKVKSVKIVYSKKNLLNFLDIAKCDEYIRTKEFKTNLFLLLGGNLENSDVRELLHEIRRGMKDKDVLLIGNKLTHPSHKKMIEYYTKSKPIADLLVKPLEILGIKKEDLNYFARFKQDKVEMVFEFKKEYKVENIKFEKGDCIIMASSYKYTEQKLNEILTTYFTEVEIFISGKKNFALCFCKK